jgi:hypothetical protein
MAKPIHKQVLERARDLVAGRRTWTRFTLALSANNRTCKPTDAHAVRFCAYGALVRAAYELTSDTNRAEELAGRAAVWLTGRPTSDEAYEAIFCINDGPPTSSRKAILRMFDDGLART